MAGLVGSTLLAGPSLARANETLNIDISLADSVEHSVGIGPIGGFYVVRDDVEFGPIAGFSADFSEFSSIQVSFRPENCARYHVAIPPGEHIDLFTRLLMFALDASEIQATPGNSSVVFEGLIGPSPEAVFERGSTGVSSEGVDVTLDHRATEAFSFRGIRVDIAGPFVSPGLRDYADLGHSHGLGTTVRQPTDDDPGPYVTVTYDDADSDGICDEVDACHGANGSGDSDGDGVCDDSDNCPTDANSGQEDDDGDGVGDACDLDAPAWAPDTAYAAGDVVTYAGELWEVRLPHTALEVWAPPGLYALWQRPTPADGEAWTDQTHYVPGSVVTYEGASYEATVDMVSQPGWTPSVAALWTEIGG